MYGYSEFLWKEGWKKGQNKVLLKAYANMKDANATDGYICSMLGISQWKLREIKKVVQ